MITPRIEVLQEKKLLGKRMTMSFLHNTTNELWRSFMPLRKEIKNGKGPELYSLQIYPPDFFERFDPGRKFEKWALIEVPDFSTRPEGMETFVLAGGLYAVFLHRGPASEGQKTFEYIFRSWLPPSGFILEDRPHFEVLGEKYKNNAPDSEEEIWIPVKKKE